MTKRASLRKKPIKEEPLLHAESNRVENETRHNMIAEEAYYLAEQRGFIGDAEAAVSDWFTAERIVEQRLASAEKPNAHVQPETLAL